MSASEELRAILVNGSPQTSVGDKVRFDAADENDGNEFIVIRRIAVERDFGLDNTLLSITERFHVECWGEWRSDAQALEDQVVARLLAAGIPPDPNDPDGLEPTVDVRCCVVIVSMFTTPEIEN